MAELVITAVATDAQGQQVQASVTVEVTEAPQSEETS
jgi:hypothetical protein